MTLKNDGNGAILNGDLRKQAIDEIASALTRLAIPSIFVTGFGRERPPGALSRASNLAKPFDPGQLLEAVRHMLSAWMRDTPDKNHAKSKA